ncbi:MULTISPECIES: cell division protein FtsQ/DivIB [Deinococcus]|uniref:Cell division protein FtsQ/DivIB n=1 Tax=Deinococcus rufus TaxID=2136097 RepID=A0ABV7ZDL5_9DEIO|nr:FtsQ-type POTRA domain-containing protein [Deinococcus sp. AB2017081]WQE96876.1 FtsQ-type POTRA domain-containing protein [Deinococcus sp. AB2017081]
MTAPGPAAPPRPRWPWIAGAVVAGAALAASWFALPVRQIGVSGNVQVPAAQIKQLAGAHAGFGWLYYGSWRARGLLDSPWIESAVVTRRFPDRVSITVTERRPVARWNAGSAVQAVAADGTVMPGGRGLERLPLIEGWGPDRHRDALRVLSALSAYNVRSVTYTPAGLRVKLPTGSIWSGDLDSLLKYAGSITMYPNTDLAIYPWGVSVQE